ncbi:hypothetical protein LTR94_031481, partial [Friedmanniomyces endolithicus]
DRAQRTTGGNHAWLARGDAGDRLRCGARPRRRGADPAGNRRTVRAGRAGIDPLYRPAAAHPFAQRSHRPDHRRVAPRQGGVRGQRRGIAVSRDERGDPGRLGGSGSRNLDLRTGREVDQDAPGGDPTSEPILFSQGAGCAVRPCRARPDGRAADRALYRAATRRCA